MIKAKLLSAAFFVSVTRSLRSRRTLGAPAQASVRIRGVIERVEASSLVVKDRSGEVVTLVRPTDMNISEVVPLTLEDIKADSFIGAGSMPQPDGTQRAAEVLVFPEAGTRYRRGLPAPGTTCPTAR